MGPQRDTDASEDPGDAGDSIESLLRSTNRDTEEIVEALRESGPRRHVSETNVDEVLTELSAPQAGDADDQFALSGGPTRTVSTSGIDEVFEALEAQAPSLPPEPRVSASNGSADGESRVNESGGSPTAMAASSSCGMAASADRCGATAVTVDPADDGESDGEEPEPFGSLVGGEPTRTIVDESVDDIIDSLEDGSPGPTDERAGRETDESVDDLRPDDPEGELVDLLAGNEPEPEATAEPGSSASATTESGPDETAAVESGDDATRIDDAAAKLARTDTAAESGSPPDPSGASTGTDDGFEWVDPGTNERSPAPTDESASNSTDADETARPLVTRTELERIAGLVSESEPVDESGTEPTTESEQSQELDRTPDPMGASGDEPNSTTTGVSRESEPTPSASQSEWPREAVSVDAVIAPTDPLGVSRRDTASGSDDRRTPSGGDPAPNGAAVEGESTDPSEREVGPGDQSLVRGIRTALRRFVGRLRR